FIKEFYDRRFPLTALNLDVGQTFGAKTFGVLGHGIHLALRRAGHTLRVESFYNATVGHGATEHFETATSKLLRKSHEFHSKPRIRLIYPEAIDGLLKGQPFEWSGDIDVEGRLPDAFEHALDEVVDVLALDEGHLDIHLSKFKLPVRPLVFIP